MLDARIVDGSFRDPAAFVYRRDGVLYRQIQERYRRDYDRLLGSGLCDELVRRRLLVEHEEVDAEPATAGAYRVLRPRELPLISYPYEWCFGQLRDAALAMLEIQSIALDHGMTLRDASAFNIQFAAGRPILIDTSSFGIAEEGRPWIAYRQFCEHFLAPLAVMAYVDARLARLSQLNVEGVPLDLAVRLLPRRARLRPSLLLHLSLHARAQRRFSGGAAPERRRAVSSRALRGLLESLRTAVSHLPPPRRTGTWSEYDATLTHYSDEASSAKASAVSTLLDEIAPRTAWDLGANVGRYSRIAAEKGIDVVAFDLDHDAVDANYRRVREDGDERLLPLVLDLAAPSPAIGWANRERMTLSERGPADVILALALIHHLAIANNVPLPRIASFLASLGRYAVVEFVPKDDVMVAALLRDREDIFPDYSPDGFVEAFATVFELRRTIPIADSSRVLYLFERR